MEAVSIQLIDTRAINQQVYDHILDNILNGIWPPGTKLPSINQLCELLGVSHVPVRDALNKLNAMGMIQTQKGGASRVMILNPGMFMNSLLPMLVLNRKSMFDILEYRRIVEPQNAFLAAKRADKADIENMFASIEAMERIARPIVEFAIADLKFHLDIARATKNSLFFNVANVIRDIMVSYYRKINEITGIDKALVYHRHVFEAIRDGDSDQARHWMEENLAVTIDEVSHGFSEEPEAQGERFNAAGSF